MTHWVLCFLVFYLVPHSGVLSTIEQIQDKVLIAQTDRLSSDPGFDFDPVTSKKFFDSTKMKVELRDFDVVRPGTDGLIRTFGKNLRPREIFEDGIFELSLQKGEDTRIIFREGICPLSHFQGYELDICDGNISLTSKGSSITGDGSGTEIPVNFTRVDVEQTVNIRIVHFNKYTSVHDQKLPVKFQASKTKVIVNDKILCEFEDSYMAFGFLHIVGGNFLKIHFKGFVYVPDPVYMPMDSVPMIY